MSNKEVVQAILEKTNGGLDYFQYVYNHTLSVNGSKCKNVKSKLYQDGNPSLSIYKYENKWRFKDYGKLESEPEHKGDVFTFAKQLHSLENFTGACERIIKDLKLDIDISAPSSFVRPEKIVEYNKEGIKPFKLYQRYSDSMRDFEMAYFNQYGISKSICYDLKIIAIDGFEGKREDGSTFKIIRQKGEIMFAYLMDEGKAAKIYRPNPKMFLWLGDKPSNYVGGFHLLSETPNEEEFVIITAGEKDAASLWSHGYQAITFNSETATIPAQILDTLKYKFQDRILVAYDIDETGKKASKLLCENNDLKALNLPSILLDKGLGKDISDYFKVCHSDDTSQEIKGVISIGKLGELISNALGKESGHLLEEKELPTAEKILPMSMSSVKELSINGGTAPLINSTCSETPTIPSEIYNTLPDLLKSACLIFDEQREKDLALLGSLAVLSGLIENVYGEYDNAKYYSNLYLFISAPASAGKGALKWTKCLGDAVHNLLKEESKAAQLEYEIANEKYKQAKEENKKVVKPEEPKSKKVYVPANSSASSFVKSIAENDGKAVLFETEADTLRYTLEKDFGNYSDSLRKAWQHEGISLSRRTDKEEIEVNCPRLSIALSGTPQQLYSLIPDAENGLFSRFCFYSFEIEPKFKNVFQKKVSNYNDYFTKLGKKALEYYLKLKVGDERSFHLTEYQQEYFLKTFEDWHSEFYRLLGGNSLATIRRLGLIEFRIAMILTALRACQSEELPEILLCSDLDFDTAIKIAEVLKKHALSIYKNISKDSKTNGLNESMESFHKSLPEDFNRAKAIEIASSLCIKDKLMEYYIKRLIETGLIQRVAFNKYVKLNN